MALLRQPVQCQIRPSNKEPEWSSICNNVFDQYLDDDDLFGLGTGQQRDRSSSNDSANLFDLSGSSVGFSGASEQSNNTSGTSPIPSWDAPVYQSPVHRLAHNAQQPQAKEPVNFWQKTLKALEQNAADCEQKQQRLRTAKSHPDFLSLGGCPSPPAIPYSPTDQSYPAQRQVSRGRMAANGRKTPTSTVRSVSRGRPTGIAKHAANPYATIRKTSVSPHKMMNPSRYRAGFKDVWIDKLAHSSKNYELRVPSQPLPASPPPSARVGQEDFAVFGSPTSFAPLPAYDAELSPLTNTFQQTRLYTPLASPLPGPGGEAADCYFVQAPPVPHNEYLPQTVPLNDTDPVFPERTSSLAANKIQTFDFGFSSSPDIDGWAAATFPEQATGHYTTTHFQDPFGGYDHAVLPSTEIHDPLSSGLGISCDPSLVSNQDSGHGLGPDIVTLPVATYQPAEPSPYYGLPQRHSMQPTALHRRSQSQLRSESPSPPLNEPRSRRASSSRRTSKHCRAKSTNSTARHSQNLDKSGFVNFTPSDSGKILNGVAPSGSSKTKARREKEAADKRRRLSQAAVKAVVEAGGSVETLQKAGLLA